MKFHNKDFELKHLKWLYNLASEYRDMRDQWQSPENLDRALEYHFKFASIVEILESLTVFHIGMGLDMERGFTDDRFESFKELLA